MGIGASDRSLDAWNLGEEDRPILMPAIPQNVMQSCGAFWCHRKRICIILQSRFLFCFFLSSLSFSSQTLPPPSHSQKAPRCRVRALVEALAPCESHLPPTDDNRVRFIEIETYALEAGVDDSIWRCNMAFELREIVIRVMITNPLSVVSLA